MIPNEENGYFHLGNNVLRKGPTPLADLASGSVVHPRTRERQYSECRYIIITATTITE